MSAVSDIPGIVFEAMEVGDRAAVGDLIAAMFSGYEPMAVAVGQSHAQFQALIGLLTAELCAHRRPDRPARGLVY